MRLLVGVDGQCDSIGPHTSRRPTRRGDSLVADVGGGRCVDDVDTPMLRTAPMMNVAVDIGLHVAAFLQHVPERLRVNQATREMDWITAQPRVVMSHDDGWFFRVRIERCRKPFHLPRTNLALRHHCFDQRIEQKKIGMAGLHDGDVAGLDDWLVWFFLFENAVKHFAIVVIPEREMNV